MNYLIILVLLIAACGCSSSTRRSAPLEDIASSGSAGEPVSVMPSGGASGSDGGSSGSAAVGAGAGSSGEAGSSGSGAGSAADGGSPSGGTPAAGMGGGSAAGSAGLGGADAQGGTAGGLGGAGSSGEGGTMLAGAAGEGGAAGAPPAECDVAATLEALLPDSFTWTGSWVECTTNFYYVGCNSTPCGSCSLSWQPPMVGASAIAQYEATCNISGRGNNACNQSAQYACSIVATSSGFAEFEVSDDGESLDVTSANVSAAWTAAGSCNEVATLSNALTAVLNPKLEAALAAVGGDCVE